MKLPFKRLIWKTSPEEYQDAPSRAMAGVRHSGLKFQRIFVILQIRKAFNAWGLSTKKNKIMSLGEFKRVFIPFVRLMDSLSTTTADDRLLAERGCRCLQRICLTDLDLAEFKLAILQLVS